MTERIELSGKNIKLNNTPPVTSTSITISHGNPKQNAEQLKQQILEDHEKRDDYDKMLEVIERVRQKEPITNHIAIGIILEENKQLKDDKEKLEMDKAILGSFKDDVEATFFMNDIDNLEDLDEKHNNLKQKLEKIKELLKQDWDDCFVWQIEGEIKQLLDEQENKE